MLEIVGHFHPLVVHLPIGILLLAVVFDILSRFERFSSLRLAVSLCWLLGATAAIVSCLTGYWLSLSGEYEGETLVRHQYSGIVTAVLASFAFVFHKIKAGKMYAFVAFVTTVGIGVAGHFGGSLTHGSDFLFKKPSKDTPSVSAGIFNKKIDLNTAIAYNDLVVPILKEKCYACHNENKQKGKLRFDTPEFMQAGGKSGAVFVAGNAEESRMIKRLLLPLDHEEHMPPKEKPQVTPTELSILRWWIEQGADWHKKVSELKPSPDIVAMMDGKSPSNKAPTVDFELPKVKVPTPSVSDLSELKKLNIVALPVSQGQPFLSINFINVNQLTDESLVLLKKLAENVVVVKVYDLELNDKTFGFLQSCKNLMHLSFSNSNINDAQLDNLLTMNSLATLNLVKTSVTLSGLEKLKSLSALKKLYIFGVPQASQTADALKKIMPTVSIDTGGYALPSLPTDTVVLTAPLPAK